MPAGAGVYDDLCSEAREKAHAVGVLLVIIGGTRGDGFSAQLPNQLLLTLPTFLRHMADEIEASYPMKKH